MVDLQKQLEEINKQDVTKGERHYSKVFRSVYSTVRKSLVAINGARKAQYEGGSRTEGKDGKFTVKRGEVSQEAELTNEQACEQTAEVLRKALAKLE